MTSVIIKLPNFTSGTTRPLDDLLSEGKFEELARELGELLNLFIRLNEKKEVQIFPDFRKKLEVLILLSDMDQSHKTILWELRIAQAEENEGLLLWSGSFNPCDIEEALDMDSENPVRYILRKQHPVFCKNTKALFQENKTVA